MMKKITPLKRSKHLVSLSRDHHQGLLIVWKLRQGIANNVATDTMGAFLVHEFRHHLEPHFQVEEEQLFAALPTNDGLRLTAESQHAQIRRLVEDTRTLTQAQKPPAEDLINAFAMVLEDHIRFEERILFPHIEKSLSEEQLENIGAHLEMKAGHNPAPIWENEFWLRK